jgi:hypothetical protein
VYGLAKAVDDYFNFKSGTAVEATAAAIKDGSGSVPEGNNLHTRRRIGARTAQDWLKNSDSSPKQ